MRPSAISGYGFLSGYQSTIPCQQNGSLTSACGRPTGHSRTSPISTYIGTHTWPMYNRSSPVTRETTRGDLAASASPLGPGHTASQKHRRRRAAASPAHRRRCQACTHAGTAPSSSSVRSTWADLTCRPRRASPAASAGSVGSLGDRRASPCPRRPRARDFFIQPEQQESTTVRQSDTLEVRCGAASGVREERARCALGVRSGLASSPGAARSKLTTSRTV